MRLCLIMGAGLAMFALFLRRDARCVRLEQTRSFFFLLLRFLSQRAQHVSLVAETSSPYGVADRCGFSRFTVMGLRSCTGMATLCMAVLATAAVGLLLRLCEHGRAAGKPGAARVVPRYACCRCVRLYAAAEPGCQRR